MNSFPLPTSHTTKRAAAHRGAREAECAICVEAVSSVVDRIALDDDAIDAFFDQAKARAEMGGEGGARGISRG